MRDSGSRSYRDILSLVVVAMLIAFGSPLFALEESDDGGNGESDAESDGSSKYGQEGTSSVSVTIDGMEFTHSVASGETGAQAVSNLIALIDADADFSASLDEPPVPPGFGPKDVAYDVVRTDASDLTSMIACEDDSVFRISAVHFFEGRSEALLLKPSGTVMGDGWLRLRFSLWSDPLPVNVNIPTVPGLATLLTNIEVALQARGFTVGNTQVGGVDYFRITKAGDWFYTARVDLTDSLLTKTCMGIRGSVAPPPPDPPSAGVPTMPRFVLVLLGVAVALIGLVVILRRTSGAG